jgi:hypothetical protein
MIATDNPILDGLAQIGWVMLLLCGIYWALVILVIIGAMAWEILKHLKGKIQ